MIYLGCDPGTSGNMALAAIFPPTFGGPSLRVRLAELASDAKDARARAPAMGAAVRCALLGLHLPIAMPGTMALEWQRPLPDDKNPQNICDLSAFAGIALATIQARFGMPLEVFLPTPNEWKGEVPKHIKHNRIVAVAGLPAVRYALQEAQIPVPSNLGSFTKKFSGMASDAIDAIGLALWARDKAALRVAVRSAILPKA